MTTPCLVIDLDKIEHNTRTIVELCKSNGIEVTGVTKVTCGHPQVAKAMLRGGVTALADSRLENIQRLINAGIDTKLMLLRLPALSSADEVVESVAVSLNSELAVLEALSTAAQQRGKVHEVILSVDLGDLCEGIWPDDLLPFAREAARLPGIHIKGLGTNLACFAGVVPDEDNMKRLVELAAEVERLTQDVHRDEVLRAGKRATLEQLAEKALEEYGLTVENLVAEYGPEQAVPVADGEKIARAAPVASDATCSTTGTASPPYSSDDGSKGRAISVDSRR